MKNTVVVLQKIKNRTIIWPSNSTAGYLSEEIQNTNLKRGMHPYGHFSITYNSQNMEAAKMSVNRKMDKEEGAYLYDGKLVIKKERNLAICDNNDRISC